LTNEVLIGTLGVFGDCFLSVSQRFDVVIVSLARLVAFLHRLPALDLHAANLLGDEGRTCPKIVDVLGEQMPAQNRELAGDRDGRYLMAFPCADPDEEGMQGTWRLRRRPSRFDEHRPGVAAADLADPAMLGEAETRLPNT